MSEILSDGLRSVLATYWGGKVLADMAKIDIAQSLLTSAPTAPPIAVETVSALMTAGGFIAMLGVWQRLMRERIFCLTNLNDNRTQENTFRKRLMSQPGMSVLLIVWKDSAFVSEAEIEAAGVARAGSACAPINCHSLAKRMATGVEDYDRLEKLIQGVVKAAEAYGLITRAQVGNTRQRALCGTILLHQLMLAFDEKVRPICGDIAGSGPGGLE